LLLKGITHIIADAAHLSPYVKKLANYINQDYSVTTHGIEVWGKLLHNIQESLLGAHLVLTVSNFTKNQLLENGIKSNKFKEKYWPNPSSFAAVLSFYTSQLPGMSSHLGLLESWDGCRWAEGLSYRAKGLRIYTESARNLGIPAVRHITWNLESLSLIS